MPEEKKEYRTPEQIAMDEKFGKMTEQELNAFWENRENMKRKNPWSPRKLGNLA